MAEVQYTTLSSLFLALFVLCLTFLSLGSIFSAFFPHFLHFIIQLSVCFWPSVFPCIPKCTVLLGNSVGCTLSAGINNLFKVCSWKHQLHMTIKILIHLYFSLPPNLMDTDCILCKGSRRAGLLEKGRPVRAWNTAPQSVTAVTPINVQSHVANVSKAGLMTTTSFKQFKDLLKKARWQRLYFY